MNKRLIISAGGTGGHLYPAMSVVEEIGTLDNSIEILFVSGGLATNRYFDPQAFPFRSISCGLFSLKGLLPIGKGIVESRRCLAEFKPDAVLGFGSYTTFPLLAAAFMKRIPIIIHEGNSLPGKVNRLFAPYASLIATFFPDTAQRFKGKTIHSDFPLRRGYRLGNATREEALHYFGLNPLKRTLLVFGGSQGAKQINLTLQKALKESPLPQEWQILHFTGNAETTAEMEAFYRQQQLCACVKNFEARMNLAWQVADLVIARAGAGTIAEQFEFEVPGLLIPYPFATDRHQDFNAAFMTHTVGGSVTIHESHLNSQTLIENIFPFLYTDRLHQLQQAIKRYKNTHQMTPLSTLVVDYLNGRYHG